MDVVISEDPNPNLAEYATIPIHFQVRLVFDVSAPADEGGELLLVERNLDTPYLKNYDAIDGEHPSQWSTRFNLSNWDFWPPMKQDGGSAKRWLLSTPQVSTC